MSSRVKTVTATTTQTVVLGEAASGRVGRWAIQIEGTGSDNWTVDVNSKSVADGDMTATAKSFWDLVAGAMATTQPASATATTYHLLVDSTGQSVELACTVTAGGPKIAAAAVEG